MIVFLKSQLFDTNAYSGFDTLKKSLFWGTLLTTAILVLIVQSDSFLLAKELVDTEQNQNPSGLKNIFFLGVSIWEWIRVSFNATVIGLISVFLREFLKNQDNKRKKKEAAIVREAQQQEKAMMEERLRYEKLEDYLDQMTEVLLKKDTLDEDEDTDQLLKAVIRARTIVVLQELDGKRRGPVIRFLADSNVINCLDLSKANLQNANLQGANLNSTCFRKANFQGANLQNAELNNANFEHADLTDANLAGADLADANLKNAQGLTLAQIQEATNWHTALYDQDFLKGLETSQKDRD